VDILSFVFGMVTTLAVLFVGFIVVGIVLYAKKNRAGK
jgi:uncharacterized membrane protein